MGHRIRVLTGGIASFRANGAGGMVVNEDIMEITDISIVTGPGGTEGYIEWDQQGDVLGRCFLTSAGHQL